MRIKSINELSNRVSGVRDVKSKIFVMLEGSSTEPNYFSLLFNEKRYSNIEFLFFEKENDEIGWSNPKKLLNYLQLFITQDERDLEFGQVKKILFEIFANELSLDAVAYKMSFNKSQNIHKISNSDIFDKEKLNLILNDLKEKSFKQLVFSDFDSIIKEVKSKLGEYTFNKEIDKIVLIVDRDKESFTDEQYNYVKTHCKKSNIDFLVTNPCFEFFLVLHFDDISDIDNEKMLRNDVEENGKKYSYNYLKSKDYGYEKNHYDVISYIKRFKNVENNLNEYVCDINKLKNHLGSNICEWVKQVDDEFN